MDLWTDKHKPKKREEILGQGSAISEVVNFVETFRPGKALFLSGSPGTGKTLIPEVVASEKKWMLVQINASDKRNSEAIENALSEVSKNHPLFHSGKIILIDEVDGTSSGDRGGIGAIVKIIKASKFPIIVTANNPYLAKLQPLRGHSKIIKLSKVNVRSIENRLKEICEREGIKADENVIKNLARWSSGDVRSAITDLQMLAEGKKEITEKDFESLGFRERKTNIFSTLPTIFRSKNINAAKKAIRDCDKDPDEIFWWVENNLYQEFKDPDSLAKALDILSKADVFRRRVSEQQNWRFKAYMVDTLAGISLAGESSHGFTPYKSPDRFIALSRARMNRAKMSGVFAKLVPYTHSSAKTVRNYYLPYLKIILSGKEKDDKEGIELEKEEVKLIVSN